MLAFSGCYYGGGEKERKELGEIRKRWDTLPVRLLKLGEISLQYILQILACHRHIFFYPFYFLLLVIEYDLCLSYMPQKCIRLYNHTFIIVDVKVQIIGCQIVSPDLSFE